MREIELRKWQRELLDALEGHSGDDFLVVASPAAGKTIGATAAATRLLAERECDQLIVVCPTVVVRNQWQLELGSLGYKMAVRSGRGGWPEHVHGACATYQRVGMCPEQFARACAERRTVVIFDEIHHAGEQRSWGEGIREAFEGAAFRLALSGTPFRSDGRAIPFIRYGEEGICEPDYIYDYPRGVREGVCRAVEFRGHDGEITWRQGGGERAASFKEEVRPEERPRRLRASLDPRRPYLRELLSSAHEDLTAQRERIPDAAGLVVCDSQAHALHVDRLLSEIAGAVPVLAISDVPRAHKAIALFAEDGAQWLVSVRMVSEGVDIPRLGVIVWATVASTELMVRQVTGRALRSRGEHAGEPALVHMPADPTLLAYARGLDGMGGVSLRERSASSRRGSRGVKVKVDRAGREIDPRPFVEWFDRQAKASGARSVLSRCGWSYGTGMRTIHRWREPNARTHVLSVFDACHMAGVDFEALFAGPEYAKARAFVDDPQVIATRGELDFRCVEATRNGHGAEAIRPALPRAATESAEGGGTLEVRTPELPPSPQEIREAEEARETARGELFRVLGVYASLRRETTPAYQIASAHAELARAVGPVGADSPDETVAEAMAWVQARIGELARRHPNAVKGLARKRRRHALAAQA